MANRRITELLTLINQQIETQEFISQQLLNISALLSIATEDEKFLNYPKWVTHHYLCAIDLLAKLALATSEEDLNFLLGIRNNFLH